MARRPRRSVIQLGSGIRIPSASLLKASGASKRARTPKDTTRSTRAAHDAYTAVLSGLSEAAFQAIVVAHLKSKRYIVVTIPDMRRTEAGWPDLAFWHPARPGVLHLWELKAIRTPVTPKQQATIRQLGTVPGIDARVVRPADWPPLRDALERGEL